MDNLETLFKELTESGSLSPLEAATEDDVLAFEREHNITLPPQYKEWLLLTDGGELCPPAGIQLYGIAHGPLVNPNDQERPSDEYLVIGALCNGDPILLDKSGGNVAIYNLESRLIEEGESYENLPEFLSDLNGILGMEG